MTYTTQLADFAHQTKFEDLPTSVVDTTKLLILDTLICGLAAQDFQRSEMARKIFEELGGPGEATVFGASARLPALSAAMVNADMMNLLDVDDTFFSSSHFAAFNVAAALALGEKFRSSGTDIIRAVAVGFDVNARVNLSMKFLDIVDGQFKWASIAGSGFASIGTMASAGIINSLDREQMRNGFGLAGWLAPGPATGRSPRQQKFWSMKYSPYAQITHAGVMAAMYAKQGFTCDQAVLDGEDGFWKMQGSVSTDQGLLIEELGTKWWVEETAIKFYPSCRYTHAPIDMLKRVMAENALDAEEIEHIEVRLNPMAYSLPVFNNPAKEIRDDHCAPSNCAFNVPYVMSLIALGRKPGPVWQKPQSFKDPAVLTFMQKVNTAADAAASDEAAIALRGERIGRFRKSGGSIVVKARGREFAVKTDYSSGDPWSPETRPTWEQVATKFHDFCGHLMREEAIDSLVGRFRNLEDYDDVSTLLDV